MYLKVVVVLRRRKSPPLSLPLSLEPLGKSPLSPSRAWETARSKPRATRMKKFLQMPHVQAPPTKSSSISVLPRDVNMLLQHKRDPSISARAAKSSATPTVMISIDSTKRVEFAGSHEAARKTGINRGNIDNIMNGRAKRARLKIAYGEFEVGEWVRFERAPSEVEQVRANAHIVKTIPCDSPRSNSLATVVFETPGSQPVFYSKSGHKKNIRDCGGYKYIKVNNFRHVSGEVKSGEIGVHDMLGSMFLPPNTFEKGKTIDHRNRNRSDNRLTNLRWATGSEQSENQTRHKTGKRELYNENNLPGEVWRPLTIANIIEKEADFREYYISNYCRVRKKNVMKKISTNKSGYTRVNINQRQFRNYRLASMVFETVLWQYLLDKGEQRIDVDHRRGVDETFLNLDECERNAADPADWYQKHVLAVREEATSRKRKRER